MWSGGELTRHQQLGSGVVHQGWAMGHGGHLHCQWSRATGDGWAGLCVSGVCQMGTVKTRQRGGDHNTGS